MKFSVFLQPRDEAHAEVAESVDASVSKTDEVTLVPVRSRPSVRKTPLNRLILRGFCFNQGVIKGAKSIYSTVTDLARLRGWSTLQPRITAIW